jgi:ankyrin repeat protein
MRTLIAYKADPNAENFDGWTPLHWCCANGRTEGTKLLLEQNSDPNAKTKKLLRTPLHLSSQNGHAADCRLLLNYQADVSARDTDGNTAILACGKNGSIPNLHQLLQFNANIWVSIVQWKSKNTIEQSTHTSN